MSCADEIFGRDNVGRADADAPPGQFSYGYSPKVGLDRGVRLVEATVFAEQIQSRGICLLVREVRVCQERRRLTVAAEQAAHCGTEPVGANLSAKPDSDYLIERDRREHLHAAPELSSSTRAEVNGSTGSRPAEQGLGGQSLVRISPIRAQPLTPLWRSAALGRLRAVSGGSVLLACAGFGEPGDDRSVVLVSGCVEGRLAGPGSPLVPLGTVSEKVTGSLERAGAAGVPEGDIDLLVAGRGIGADQ